ncbi:DNA (cytosine-5-)-methyltransferase, partial [Vibrio cholerae]
VSNVRDKHLIASSFQSSLVNHQPVSVAEALDDLKHNYPSEPSNFIRNLNAIFDRLPQRNEISNHEFRNNGEVVQRRFRLYQVLAAIDERVVTKAIFAVLRGESDSLPSAVWARCSQYRFLQLDGTLQHFDSKTD